MSNMLVYVTIKIFNLIDNYLEAYSEPYQGKYGYLNKRIILSNQTVNLACFPG